MHKFLPQPQPQQATAENFLILLKETDTISPWRQGSFNWPCHCAPWSCVAYWWSRHERGRGTETTIRVRFSDHSSLCSWGDLSFSAEAGYVLLKHPVIRPYFLSGSQYHALYHIVIEQGVCFLRLSIAAVFTSQAPLLTSRLEMLVFSWFLKRADWYISNVLDLYSWYMRFESRFRYWLS